MKADFFTRGIAPALVLLLMPWPLAAQDGVAQMEAFFAELVGFGAGFDQIQVDGQGQIVQQSRGTVKIRRPGRFRWDYTEPYAQLVLGDGARVWTYDEDLEQATVKGQDALLAGTPAVLLSTQQRPQEVFEVSDGGRSGLETWALLRPRAEDNQFQQVRLGFIGGELTRMELYDNFGQTTFFHFYDIQRNLPMDDALFRFELPPGVDLIGDVELATQP